MCSVRAHSKWSTFQMKWMLRFRYTPQLKQSLTADHILADLCLQWEPIWNSHLHNSFTLCHLGLSYWKGKSYIYHLWKWSNLCKISCFCCCSCCAYDFMLLLLCVHNYTWITTASRTTTKNENKKNSCKIDLFVLILIVISVSYCCYSSVITNAQWGMNNNMTQ